MLVSKKILVFCIIFFLFVTNLFFLPALAYEDKHVLTSPNVFVEIEKIMPEILTPEKNLDIEISVNNSSDIVLDNLDLNVFINETKLVSRQAIEIWENTSNNVNSKNILTKNLAELIYPKTKKSLTLSVPNEVLKSYLADESWGPIGIAVELKTNKSENEIKLSKLFLPSFVVWYPNKEFLPTKLTMLAGLLSPAAQPDTGLVSEDTLNQMISPNSEINNIIAATDGYLTNWALDPLLFKSLANFSDKENINNWLENFVQKNVNNNLVALPYADANFEVLNFLQNFLDPKIFKTAQNSFYKNSDVLENVFDQQKIPNVYWSYDSFNDLTSFLDMKKNFPSTLLAKSSFFPEVSEIFTPNSHVNLKMNDIDSNVLLIDDVLSDLLNETNDTSKTALLTQRFLAELAAITLERPGESRNILMVAQRDWKPNPQVVQNIFQALSAADWVEFSDINSLLNMPAKDVNIKNISTDDVYEKNFPSTSLAKIALNINEVEQFSTIFVEPNKNIQLLLENVITLTSTSLVYKPEKYTRLEQSWQMVIENLLNSVEIIPGSSINLLANSSKFDVTVVNRNPQEVKVNLKVKPSIPRVKIAEIMPITIAGNERSKFEIPIQAIGNGQVTLDMSLVSVAGLEIGKNTTRDVRVLASWESFGTLGFIIITISFLFFGLMRTINKNSRKKYRRNNV